MQVSGRSQPQAFQEIPVIDVAPLLQDDKNLKPQIARELHAACRDVGFFYIQNHGLEGLTSSVLEAAERWFALPEARKKEIELSPTSHFRGYQPLGVNVTTHEEGFSRDWHEGIDFYREGQAGCEEETPVHGKNLWPQQHPEFVKLLKTYFQACLQLGQVLMRVGQSRDTEHGISTGLGLQEDFFERPEAGGTTSATSYFVARVLHYPPLCQGDSHQPGLAEQAAKGEETERSLQLSCGEHSDYGLLTLVNQQDGVTALQAKNQAGKWINAKPIPGTLVCNIGDMLKVYTNGIYTPTVHRVVNTDLSKSRVSLPFFYECAFEARVSPIPQLLESGQKASHESVKYGAHLLKKVLSNFNFDNVTNSVTA